MHGYRSVLKQPILESTGNSYRGAKQGQCGIGDLVGRSRYGGTQHLYSIDAETPSALVHVRTYQKIGLYLFEGFASVSA